MRIIGDIHGKFDEYRNMILNDRVKSSIQVGDFGIGFGNSIWHDRVNEFHKSHDHRFIRGNHDFPKKCKKEMIGYIQDGFVENDVMYIGGAWSIDQSSRIEGISWWSDEQLSYTEFNKIIDIYSTVKPNVLITHDAPEEIALDMFIHNRTKQYKTITSSALQVMFEIHQPKFWFFGHWHKTKEYDKNGTHFHCLAELDYVDFNVNALSYE